MTQSRRVLVARPEPGAGETVAWLEARGVAATALPLIEILPLEPDAAARQRVSDLDLYDIVIFVSPAAVRHGMPWIDRYWPQYPLVPTWMAVGDRTARELESWGLQVLAPSGDATSEGLLARPELADVASRRVLIVKGVGGRELLAAELTERGARVEVLEVYRRRQQRAPLPPAEELLAVVGSSSEVVDALRAADVTAALLDVPLLVPSPRVAAHARALGYSRVILMQGASPDATLAAVAGLGNEA